MTSFATQWLPAIRPTIRATTFLSYEGHIENHLSPTFGRIPLQQLSPAHINAFYAKLLTESRAGRALPENRKKDEELKPLAPATVRRIHATLHRALRDAVRWNLIGRNPADAADPPRAVGCAGAAGERLEHHRSQEVPRERAGELDSIPCGFFSSPPACAGERPWDSAGRTSILRREHHRHPPDPGAAWISSPCSQPPRPRRGRRLVALDPVTTTVSLPICGTAREEESVRKGQRLEPGRHRLHRTRRGAPSSGTGDPLLSDSEQERRAYR